ncbi:MAG: 50S ribosomal protein L22, partial [Bacteroidales bacterium]|nr:50S ribosomal protein L22 [Bacteroidales bacterium]
MGARKRLRAEKTKEAKKSLFQAKLNDCPTSPRKMRLVADMIRGENVELVL